MPWQIIEVEGRRRRFAVAPDRGFVWIGYRGDTHRGRDEAQIRPASVDDDRRIRAPMTARVVSVEVSVGEQVSAGTLLVILEAMKMEYRLTAPRDGTVAAVLVTPGLLVDLGVEVVRLS